MFRHIPWVWKEQFLLSRQLQVVSGCNVQRAVHAEKALQEEILARFKDIRGSSITFDPALSHPNHLRLPAKLQTGSIFRLAVSGCRVPLDLSPPVGTNGVMRMLHRWRRAIHA